MVQNMVIVITVAKAEPRSTAPTSAAAQANTFGAPGQKIQPATEAITSSGIDRNIVGAMRLAIPRLYQNE